METIFFFIKGFPFLLSYNENLQNPILENLISIIMLALFSLPLFCCMCFTMSALFAGKSIALSSLTTGADEFPFEAAA